jgi:hypothetical protein
MRLRRKDAKTGRLEIRRFRAVATDQINVEGNSMA